jgi:hypothetical protein
VLAEGGITRMMGIFTNMADIDKLGSMRSLRPYYLSISMSYDAITVHAGGSEQAYSDVKTLGADDIDGVRGSYATVPFTATNPARNTASSTAFSPPEPE